MHASIDKCCNIISDIIEKQEVIPKSGNDITRTRDFTDLLLVKLGIKHPSITASNKPLKKGNTVRCKVTGWNSSFVYVDLLDHNQTGSIHVKYINGTFIYDIGDVLSEGQEIAAKVVNDKPHPIFGYQLSMI